MLKYPPFSFSSVLFCVALLWWVGALCSVSYAQSMQPKRMVKKDESRKKERRNPPQSTQVEPGKRTEGTTRNDKNLRKTRQTLAKLDRRNQRRQNAAARNGTANEYRKMSKKMANKQPVPKENPNAKRAERNMARREKKIEQRREIVISDHLKYYRRHSSPEALAKKLRNMEGETEAVKLPPKKDPAKRLPDVSRETGNLNVGLLRNQQKDMRRQAAAFLSAPGGGGKGHYKPKPEQDKPRKMKNPTELAKGYRKPRYSRVMTGDKGGKGLKYRYDRKESSIWEKPRTVN